MHKGVASIVLSGLLLLISSSVGQASVRAVGCCCYLPHWRMEPVRHFVGYRSFYRCNPMRAFPFRSPAQDYAAFYYRSRGGVGPGYSTWVYSTDGRERHYAR